MTLAGIIAAFCSEQKVTRAELARRIGISRDALNRKMYSGSRVTVDEAVKLSRELGVDVSVICDAVKSGD